jgi:hypothetical protein
MNALLRGHGVTVLLLVAVVMVMASGCKSTYYKTWEKFGVHKRDILKERVEEARDEQKAAGEEFKDALTRLKELYAFEGGELEKAYKSLQSEYDDCSSRAEAVRNRIRSMETVAEDLFVEWEKEISQISTPSLQEGSRKQLAATRERYKGLHSALKSAETAMNPVLIQFKDHVLYLKHNLNAQAVASLKGEATNIQSEISKLITQMNASIAKADEFIKTLE